MRMVIDLWEWNANTKKMASPLPDMNAILWHAAAWHWWSLIDMLRVFEQVWIIHEHVDWSAVTMSDGNIISNVMQIGDCNASAT